MTSFTTLFAPKGARNTPSTRNIPVINLNPNRPTIPPEIFNTFEAPAISTSLLSVNLPPIPTRRLPKEDKEPPKRRLTLNGKVPFVEGDDEKNPFTIPPDMQEFMEFINAEKAKRREAETNLPTMKKQTNAIKNTQTVLERLRPFFQHQFKPTAASVFKEVTWKAQTGLHINHLQKVSRKVHSDYLTHRKTVYYLRRAIRTRYQALDLLQKRRMDEEAALNNYEWMTDYMQESFGVFLKENDDATMDATVAAEIALKEKMSKALQVRELNIKINGLKSEIIGANESLRECKVYMSFLDEIAREGMRKDEEEANRAYRRQQQIKEEIVNLTKQGKTLKEAQAIVAANQAKFDDKRIALSGAHAGGKSSSLELITGLNKQLQETLDEHKRVHADSIEQESGIEEYLGLGKGNKKRLTLEREGSEEDNEMTGIVVIEHHEHGGDVGRGKAMKRKLKLGKGKSQLADRTSKPFGRKSKAGKQKRAWGAAPPKKKTLAKQIGDGYNEAALLKSLDLVPGTEREDMRELASLSFTRPSQLLQIYSDMEEQNLSLIQHSQASEEVLDQVNIQIRNTRKSLSEKSRRLRKEINAMEQDITFNEERGNVLRQLVDMFTGGNYNVRQQQKLFRILRRHVGKVYKAAVGNVDQHLSPLLMLTSIEKNFEDLVKEIQTMPDEIILQISRELDKERREVERTEKFSRRKQIEGERAAKNLDRARAPIRIKKGRPLYPRSRPPKLRIKLSQAELEKKAEQDEFNYFFGP